MAIEWLSKSLTIFCWKAHINPNSVYIVASSMDAICVRYFYIDTTSTNLPKMIISVIGTAEGIQESLAWINVGF